VYNIYVNIGNSTKTADAAWSWYLLLQQRTGCKDEHYIEENHEAPKGKTKIVCGEIICCTKEGGKFRRK
jgi:hypothetical protein